jgi:hypothetical protein
MGTSPLFLSNLESNIKFIDCYAPYIVLNNPLACGMNVSINIYYKLTFLK